MIVLPAGFALAFALYFLLPQTADVLVYLLARAYQRQPVRKPRPIAFSTLLATLAFFLSLVHPALTALTLAPLFTGLASVPRAAEVKRRLDGGACAGDVAAYEAQVMESCEGFAPAFSGEVVVPLLLCALSLALRLGGALGWAWLGLRAACGEEGGPARLLAHLARVGDALLFALSLVCACIVGRNPFRTRGAGAQARLVSVLGIAQDDTRIHAPVAGDIAQGALVCGVSAWLLCVALALLLALLGA